MSDSKKDDHKDEHKDDHAKKEHHGILAGLKDGGHKLKESLAKGADNANQAVSKLGHKEEKKDGEKVPVEEKKDAHTEKPKEGEDGYSFGDNVRDETTKITHALFGKSNEDAKHKLEKPFNGGEEKK